MDIGRQGQAEAASLQLQLHHAQLPENIQAQPHTAEAVLRAAAAEALLQLLGTAAQLAVRRKAGADVGKELHHVLPGGGKKAALMAAQAKSLPEAAVEFLCLQNMQIYQAQLHGAQPPELIDLQMESHIHPLAHPELLGSAAAAEPDGLELHPVPGGQAEAQVLAAAYGTQLQDGHLTEAEQGLGAAGAAGL